MGSTLCYMGTTCLAGIGLAWDACREAKLGECQQREKMQQGRDPEQVGCGAWGVPGGYRVVGHTPEALHSPCMSEGEDPAERMSRHQG